MVSIYAGCARIQTTTTFSDTLIERRSHVTAVDGSLEYSATGEIVGTALVVKLESEQTCTTKVTPVYRRTALLTRVPAPNASGTVLHPATFLVVGALLVAGGAYVYGSADVLAQRDVDMGVEKPTSPDGYRDLGLVTGATGVVLGGIAAIDGLRLRDETRNIGEVDGDPKITNGRCRRRAASRAEVIGRLERIPAVTFGAITDDEGRVELALANLPAAAFSGGPLVVRLAVADAETSVTIGGTDAEALLARLAADPTSRISRDREAKRTATCEGLVEALGEETVTADTGDRELARMQREWAEARSRCGDKWRSEHEQRFARFEADVQRSAGERAERNCKDAITLARESLDLNPDDGDAIDQARTACPGNAAALAELETHQRTRRVERAKAEKAAVAETARQAKRATAERVLREKLDVHDAVGVQAAIARDTEASAILRREPAIALTIASYWIAQIERGSTSANMRAQLCASQKLVVTFIGGNQWSKLREQAAARHGVVAGAKIAKQLETGACK